MGQDEFSETILQKTVIFSDFGHDTESLNKVDVRPKGVQDMFKQLRAIHSNLRFKGGLSPKTIETPVISDPIHIEAMTSISDASKEQSVGLYGDEMNMERFLEDTMRFEPAPPKVYRKRKRILDGSLYYFSNFVIFSMKVFYKLLAVFGDLACKYPNQTSFLALIFAIYVSIRMLEFSVTGLIELLISMSWPMTYAGLRAWEHILRGIGNGAAHLNAVYRGLQCDLTRIWCTHFQLRCDQRCSFTESALHHIS